MERDWKPAVLLDLGEGREVRRSGPVRLRKGVAVKTYALRGGQLSKQISVIDPNRVIPGLRNFVVMGEFR